MERETVLAYFDSEGVVDHYADAAARIGLWQSEGKLFTRLFKKGDSILELGCGAGRIAFGLHELGYYHVLATDYSKQMIKRARHMAKILEYPIHFQMCDATRINYEDGIFDGVIFGFNGLMQIPKAEQREKAMREVLRVLRPGAWFVFTTHDRANPKNRKFWEQEKLRWRRSKQKADLDDFGDRFEPTDLGDLYIHIPTIQETEQTLKAVGFRIEASIPRSALANESSEVRDFADECRFWVVQKPTDERG